MTRLTKSEFRFAREEVEKTILNLRWKLDDLIDELHDSIDNLEAIEIIDIADSTEKITFANYVNDCTHKLKEYENLLLQIMEKTL